MVEMIRVLGAIQPIMFPRYNHLAGNFQKRSEISESAPFSFCPIKSREKIVYPVADLTLVDRQRMVGDWGLTP